MNILIFNWRDLKHSWAGGGEIYVFETAKRWVKMGHNVTVFCSLDKEKNLSEIDSYDGINIIRKGGRFSVYPWAIWYYLTRLKGKFDVIVDVENGIPFFTPLISRTPKVAFVFHIHGKQFFYEFPFPLSNIGVFIEKYMFPFIYRNVPVVAISKTTKKDLLDIGFPQKNISVVYCGISTNYKKDKPPINKFITPTLLYLGRIKAYKRIDVLLDIFSKLLKRNENLKLIIAGWGTEASYITDLVMKSPNRRKIKLMGPVSEVEKEHLLLKSWVFVNPSIGEGWSISVIEANFYGTPAVAFNVPGLSESIKHSETGLLAKNKEEMTLFLEKIIKNHNLRNQLSINAWKWARRFSWDKAAKESMSILERQIER